MIMKLHRNSLKKWNIYINSLMGQYQIYHKLQASMEIVNRIAKKLKNIDTVYKTGRNYFTSSLRKGLLDWGFIRNLHHG